MQAMTARISVLRESKLDYILYRIRYGARDALAFINKLEIAPAFSKRISRPIAVIPKVVIQVVL